MPRRTTILEKDHYYHIYNKAVTGSYLFTEDKNYRFFISKIKRYLLEVSNIISYCLMPNHYHLIMQLRSPDLPVAMGQLGMSYSKSFNMVHKRKGHLFQGRYQSKLIEDDNYLVYLSRYIHLNPVSAGLVNYPEVWEYSSYRKYIGMVPIGFIKPMCILDLFCDQSKSTLEQKQQNYKEYVEDQFII